MCKDDWLHIIEILLTLSPSFEICVNQDYLGYIPDPSIKRIVTCNDNILIRVISQFKEEVKYDIVSECELFCKSSILASRISQIIRIVSLTEPVLLLLAISQG